MGNQGNQQQNIDPQTGQPWDLNDPDAVTRKSQQESGQSSQSGVQPGGTGTRSGDSRGTQEQR